MSDYFDACVAVTLRYEGGYADNPADPGGATNYGITARTLASFLNRPVTIGDVKGMTRDTAMAIYRRNYWNSMRCGSMPAGLGLAVFDFGVNSGGTTADETLQRLVGVMQDGAIGPVTLAAVNANDPIALIDALSNARMAFLQSLPTFAVFGGGWVPRVFGVRDAAKQMAGAVGSVAPATPVAEPQSTADQLDAQYNPGVPT